LTPFGAQLVSYPKLVPYFSWRPVVFGCSFSTSLGTILALKIAFRYLFLTTSVAKLNFSTVH